MYLVYNQNTPGQKSKEYAEQQFDKFISKELNFNPIRNIKDEYVTEYEKIFITNNGFHPVGKSSNQYGYKDHIRSYQYHYIDKDNKTMLISDKSLELLDLLLSEEKPKQYRYKLSSLKESSTKYGNCEICGEYVSEVYCQFEEKSFIYGDKEHWTYHNCNNFIGHKGCLINKRR